MRALSTRLHGNVLRETSIAGFILTERAYAPNLRLPEHSHQEPDFCFVLAGSFTEISGNQVRSCRAQSVLFHPPGDAHSDCFHSDTRCLGLQFDRSTADCWQPKLANSAISSVGGRLSRLAAQLYREFCASDAVSGIMIEGLILQMMAEAFRRGSEPAPVAPPWLEQAKKLLCESLGSRPSLIDLAGSVGVHPVHLSREFRRFYGCTMSEFILQRRLDFACQELLNARASLTEVALAAGFFDQSHFTRTFKTRIGMSPNQYRATLRGLS